MSAYNGKGILEVPRHILIPDPKTGSQKKIGEYGMIGVSPLMQAVYGLITMYAPTPFLVHIGGESGTGKELVARALHYYSQRKDGPFFAFNCAAVAEGLLESELFGHERGAFTGAVNQHTGYLEKANATTLFIDEIGKMSHGMQAKLLRPLDGYGFKRVGGTIDIQVDVRFVTASSTSLEDALRSGRISEEFYHRIWGITINLPPLRERGEDVKLLADHFCERASKACGKRLALSGEAYESLESRLWKGNVRQLKRTIEAAVAKKNVPTSEQTNDKPLYLEASDIIVPPEQQLPYKSRDGSHTLPYTPDFAISLESLPVNLSLTDVIELCIKEALTFTGGNLTQAAAILGVNRSTVYRKARRYDIVKNTHSGKLLQEVLDQYTKKVLDSVDGNKLKAAAILGVDEKTISSRLNRLETISQTANAAHG